MKENRELGLKLTLEAEDRKLTGEITVDAGGRTRYGIAEKYNPDLWKNGPPSLEDAKRAYINRYWIEGGCDALPYPMDIAMFDCCVNPGLGAARTILSHNTDLSGFMRARMRWYCRNVIDRPHLLKNLPGWILRCLNLWRDLDTK